MKNCPTFTSCVQQLANHVDTEFAC